MRSLMFRVVQLLSAIMVAVVGLYGAMPPTVTQAATAPSPTKSWYVSSLSGMYSKGSSVCSQKGYLVLDFGQAIKQGTPYGVWSQIDTFWSTSDIEPAVKQFLDGYASCASTSDILRVMVGTSNYRGTQGIGTPTTDSAGHATAWATMINNLDSYITQQNYGAKVAVAGAIDAELDWNYAGDTMEWGSIFSSNANPAVFYYNFGDAAGCPVSGTTSTPGSCNNGWSQASVWLMSWGYAAALPLPEIYNQSMADEWQQLTLYGVLSQSSKMLIHAVMVQHQSCVEKGYPTTYVETCDGAFFTYDQAWNAMQTDLNSDSRTAQTVSGTTDIRENW